MRQLEKSLVADLRRAYMNLHGRVDAIKGDATTTLTQKERVDAIYALKESYDLADKVRKEIKHAIEDAERACCLVAIHSGDVSSIRTEHCTATPDIKMTAAMPSRHKQPELYAKFMAYLNIPEQLWKVPEGEAPAVEPHWPGMVDLISRLMEQGKPLPPGVDREKTYPVYRVVIRRKKGADED